METRSDRPAAAVLLAGIAWCVDAVGFITLNGLFLSFMSGNVTRMGLAGVDRFWGTAGLALGLLGLFVGGVAAGTLVGMRMRRGRAGLVMLVAAVLVGASAWLGMRTGHAGIPTLVMAMGLLNTAFPGLGVTYVTGALVRIGEAVGGDPVRRAYLGFDLALVAALAGGVVIGARFWPDFGPALLLVPAALLVLAAIAHFVPPRRRVARAVDPT